MNKAKYPAHKSFIISFFALTLSLLFILPGCCYQIDPDPTPNKVQNQEDLGSIHITVFPPVEFENYKSALSPKFSLTGDLALKEVAPYTTALQSNRYSGLSGGLSANLGTLSDDKTTILTSKDGKTSKEVKETITDKYGEVPETVEATGADKRVLKPEPYSQTMERLDPMTRYWAAAALYQEVQLLNRYISDLDTDDDYQAYVVRVQISQIPYVRRAPYDSITDLNFFIKGDNSNKVTTPIVLPMLVTDNLEAASGNYNTETVRSLALALKGSIGSVGVGASVDAYNQLKKEILGRDLNSLLTVARLHDNILRVRLGAMQQANHLYAVVPHNQTVSVVILVKREDIKETSIKHKLVIMSHTEWRHTEDPKKNLKSATTTTAASSKEFNELLDQYGFLPIGKETYISLLLDYTTSNFDDFKEEVTSSLKFKSKPGYQADRNSSEDRVNELQNQIKKLGESLEQYQKLSGFTAKCIYGLIEPQYTPQGYTRVINEHNARLVWGLFAKHLAESAYDRTAISLPAYPTPPVISSIYNNTKLYLFDDGKSKMQVTIPALAHKPFPARIYGKAVFYYYCNNNDDNNDDCKNDGDKKDDVKKNCCEFPVFSIASALSNDQRGIVLTFPSALILGYQGLKPKTIYLYWINDNVKTNGDDKPAPVLLIGPEDGFKDPILVKPAKQIAVATEVKIKGNQEAVPVDGEGKATLHVYSPKPADEDGSYIILEIKGAVMRSNGSVTTSVKITGESHRELKLEGLIKDQTFDVVLKNEHGVTSKLATLKAVLNK